VPGDVSLVGFDDVVLQHLFAPPVTAVRQPVAALGPRAVTLLVETAWQEASGFGQELVPVDLVVRGSVAPPADA
jgi:LacI family transcriptional regulator